MYARVSYLKNSIVPNQAARFSNRKKQPVSAVLTVFIRHSLLGAALLFQHGDLPVPIHATY